MPRTTSRRSRPPAGCSWTASPSGSTSTTPQPSRREVAYLRTIGQRSLVILPLLVRGESIGTVELTSDRSNAFTERGIQLAQLLAREAAISLENARLYDQIHHQAFRDALTGLANRVLFHDRVTHALDRIRGRSPFRAAVLFLDVDHFKLLNDRFGHSRGDEVLQVVAERVRAAIRPGDTAARLGGDEFAILLEEIDGPATAIVVADRLLEGLAEPIELGEGSPRVGASIGIALSGIGGAGDDSTDDLLRNADIAMYAAKAAGRGRVEIFRPELLHQAAARSELGARLRGAADRNELRLQYQPIVDLGNGGQTVGLEALVRWQPAGLEPPHARRLHRPGRGDRRDRADRALGHHRGLPPGPRLAAGPRSPGPADQRQPVGPPVRRSRARLRGRRGPPRERPRHRPA